MVDFDTGSPTFWTLTDTACTEATYMAKCPPTIPKYESSKSSEYKIFGTDVNNRTGEYIGYGTGAIMGWPSSDKFCFD
tara:strand:+ start:289 stop:522 length:234 start_codon:yes stop_codon:yes gene_type:complete